MDGDLPGIEHSFLLLKPDGVRRRLHGVVDRAIERAGLVVTCRHALRLDVTDIARAWADTRRRDHPLEHLTLDFWYEGEPTEAWIVAGPQALTRAREVKAALRSSYRLGPFGNVVHSPDHRAEFELQVSVFGRGCERCETLLLGDFSDYDTVPQAYEGGALLPEPVRDVACLRPMVEPRWRNPGSCFWRPTFPEPYGVDVRAVTGVEHALYLVHSPHQLSFDNLVGGLLETLPGLPLEQALEIVISSLHHADFTIALGSARECQAYKANLERRGMLALIRPVLDDPYFMHEWAARGQPLEAAGASRDGTAPC